MPAFSNGSGENSTIRAFAGFERIEQLLQPLLELRQAGLPFERFVRAVADEDHRRLQCQRLIDQLVEALVGVGEVEAAAGLAADGVAAPAEVAEGDALVGVGGDERGLPVAVALLAFDERTADPDDAVAVLELEGLLGGGLGEHERGERRRGT